MSANISNAIINADDELLAGVTRYLAARPAASCGTFKCRQPTSAKILKS
jgi:hypothetical protein